MLMWPESAHHPPDFGTDHLQGCKQFGRVKIPLQDDLVCHRSCACRLNTPVDTKCCGACSLHFMKALPGTFCKQDNRSCLAAGRDNLPDIWQRKCFEIGLA